MAEAILAQVGSCKSILTALNGRPGVAKVSEQEGRRLQQALRCTAVANDDMGRIAHAIKEAAFQEGDEQALLDVVADVASSRVSAPCAKMQRTSTQDWLEFVHYIPGNIWHELEQGLVNGFMDFLFRLGLRHPSEPTFSLMATMTCVQADGLDKVLNMADEVKLQYVGSIKAMFRSQLKKWLAPCNYVLSLPRKPEEFRRDYRALYDNAFRGLDPSPCPDTEVQLATLLARGRCRAERGTGASKRKAFGGPLQLDLGLGAASSNSQLLQFGQGLVMAMQSLTEQVSRLQSGSQGAHGGGSANPLMLQAGAGRRQLALPAPVAGSKLGDVAAALAGQAEAQGPPEPKRMPPVLDEEPKPMPPFAAVDEVPMTKTCTRSVEDVAEELRKTLAAKASQKAEGKGKATGKAKSEAKGKVQGKAKAAEKSSPKAKSAPSLSVTSPTKKVPSMPPLQKTPPVKFLTCTIYTDMAKRAWRVVEWTNMRRDIRYPWKDEPQNVWKSVIQCCRDLSK